jgi:S1-C subfamily serine protease
VIGTTKGGPADSAGMKSGDVIVSVDGNAVASAHDLGDILGGLQPGASVSVVVDRGGQQVTLDVTLAARPLPSQLP